MISNTVIIVGIVIGSLMLLVLLLIWGLKGKNEVGWVGFFIGFLGTLLVGLSAFIPAQNGNDLCFAKSEFLHNSKVNVFCYFRVGCYRGSLHELAPWSMDYCHPSPQPPA